LPWTAGAAAEDLPGSAAAGLDRGSPRAAASIDAIAASAAAAASSAEAPAEALPPPEAWLVEAHPKRVKVKTKAKKMVILDI
jgi:hypothetical protein